MGSQVWDLGKAQTLGHDALELAQALGDRAAEARANWILLLVNRFGQEGARTAAAYGERSLVLARELGLKEQLAFTLKDLAVAYVVTGRFREASTLEREAVELWRQLDNKPMLAEVLGGRVAQRVAAGELAEAIAAGEESAALTAAVLAEICLYRGRPVEADGLLTPYRELTFRDMLEATTAISPRPSYAQAEVALAQGDSAPRAGRHR